MTEGIIFEPRNNYRHEAKENFIYDLIVIGTGVAGYSSAMYASRLGLKVLIIGEIPGGTLSFSGKVENYPGFISIEGQKLTQLLENHAMDYDVDVLLDKATKITKEEEFNVFCEEKIYKSKTIIYATGGKVKKLNIKGEEEFFGKGVGYCALCDAAFVKDKLVAVVGGGDSAVKEAILVSEYAKKVFIINNENETHPEEHNRKALNKLISENKIEVINNNEVLEIIGLETVNKLILKNSKELDVQGIFIYIGHIPNSQLAKELGVALNQKEEIIITPHCETNIKGFFSAGDVTNLDWKQAIIGVSQGVTSAYYAYQYLNSLK